MRYEKADRINELVLELRASRVGLTLSDIEARFGVGRRTAQRMRAAVARRHPELEEIVDDERRKRWRLPARVAPVGLTFTADELADLETVVPLLRRENLRARAEAVQRIAAKIRAGVAGNVARRIEPDLEALLEAEGLAMAPGPRPIVKPEILGSLREAIKQCRQVYITHENRRTRRHTGRRVHPYGFLLGRRHYLVAHCPGQTPDYKLFALPNITSVKISDESFRRDPTFSIQKFAEQSFGVFQEPPYDVVWRFSPAAAQSAMEYQFHPSQTMELQPDGSLVVRFRAGGLLEMCWHVYTWGRDIEVLAPRELIDLCARGGNVAVDFILDRHLKVSRSSLSST